MNFGMRRVKSEFSPAAGCKLMNSSASIMIGWTTTANREQAESLARGLVEKGLVACAQIEGPITSIYRWQGTIETGPEYRLALKFAATRAGEVEAWLAKHHTYDSPQWICIKADAASKNYLNWVMQAST